MTHSYTEPKPPERVDYLETFIPYHQRQQFREAYTRWSQCCPLAKLVHSAQYDWSYGDLMAEIGILNRRMSHIKGLSD